MAAVDILRAFAEPPPPFDFVLPGMLAGSVGFLLSPGGAGKSMFALEAACAIASGTKDGDLLGLEPKQGHVLFVGAEDPVLAFEHRLHAMGASFSPETRDLIAQSLHVESVLGHRPDIMDERWQRWLLEWKGTRLIVLDTLTRFHQLDENSNSDMGKVISTLEYIAVQTGAAILVLHHSSKAMAILGRGDEQQAARGASAIIDNARWASNLISMTKAEADNMSDVHEGKGIGDDGRGYYVRMMISKQNHGRPMPEMWLVRTNGGVLKPVTLYPAGKPEKKAQRGNV